MSERVFTISQKRPIRPEMTVSRPAGLGETVPVTWFSLGAGESFRFDKNGLHSVTAQGKFKMSLLLVLE